MAYATKHLVEAVDYYPRGDGMKRSVAFVFDLSCFDAIGLCSRKEKTAGGESRSPNSLDAGDADAGRLSTV
jgi:hypothetical protein